MVPVKIFDVKSPGPDGGQVKNENYHQDYNEPLKSALDIGRAEGKRTSDGKCKIDKYIKLPGGQIAPGKNPAD